LSVCLSSVCNARAPYSGGKRGERGGYSLLSDFLAMPLILYHMIVFFLKQVALFTAEHCQ